MREAYPDHYGAPLGNALGGDRLTNLRRAIDSVEHRLNGQISTPPKNEIGILQQQIDRLSNQVGFGQTQPGFAPIAPNLDGTAAEILRRQQMLQQSEAMAAEAAQAQAMQQQLQDEQQQAIKKQQQFHRQQQQNTAAHEEKLQRQQQQAHEQQQHSQSQQRKAMEVVTKQFDVLKAELSALKKQVSKPVAVASKISNDEIKRIAESLSGIQKAPVLDDKAFGQLTSELAQLRAEMRRDLKKEVANTQDISSRLTTLSQGIDTMALQTGNALTPRVDGLASQLDAMRTTIDDLPQTLAISRLEERLGTMASKIDAIPELLPQDKPTDFSSIEGRLDEIARALVAVSNIGSRKPELDLSALDNLDTRFADIGKAMEELAHGQSQTLENKEVKALARRIEGLTDRLGSFEKYAEAGDLGAASAMFAGPETGVIEEQLLQLSARLDEAAATNSTSSQMSNLEAQVGQILRHLNSVEAPSIDFAPMESRLGQIESKISSNQKFSLEAAQQAAQQAVVLLGDKSDHGKVIASLSDDLKSLQSISESGAVENTKSISEMNGVLSQIVDRLGTIEHSIGEASARMDQVAEQPAPQPQMAPAYTEQSVAFPQHAPVEQAAVQHVETAPTANYTISAGGYDDAPIETRGPQEPMPVNAPSLDPATDIESNMSAESESHQPLEPNSQAPDLNNLVQQASAELEEARASYDSGDASYGSGADNIRPDPVGAARRALQATTNEMNAVRDDVQSDGKEKASDASKAGLLAKLRGINLRKPLLIAAAATLLFVASAVGYNQLKGGDTKIAATNNATVVEKTAKAPAAQSKITTLQNSTETAIVDAPRKARSVDGSNSVVAATPKVMTQTSEIISGDDSGPAISAPEVKSNEVVVTPQPVQKPVELAKVEPEAPAKVYTVAANSGPAPLVQAASTGDPKALFELGMRYSNGKVVKRDMVQSAKWFEHSAESGFAPAQYSIGSLYEKGIGVEKNVKLAASWYGKAAAQGNARAMHNLAVINAMGSAGEPNMDVAVRWFKDAANYGIKDSQFNLGILYGQGMGVPQNLGESYKWFALAAKTGDTDAAKKRDEVSKAMDPSNLEASRTQVANWKPAVPEAATNKVVVPPQWRGKNAKSSATTSVQKAQVLLNERGFDVGTPDGLFGPKTQRAIMEFQRGAGLAVTGKIDPKLIQALGGSV